MLKKYLPSLLYAAVIVLSLGSCSSLYSPNVPAAPMFRSQGEMYVSGHLNLRGNISANAGVAVTDHMAVIANASTISKDDGNDFYKQQMAEVGLGYFTAFGEHKKRVFEVYAGYGLGKFNQQELRSSTTGYELVEDQLANFSKIFVQVNYSSTRRKKIKIFGEENELNYGTILRLSQVQMKDFKLNAQAAPNENNIFIEPVFYTRMGLNRFLQVQYTTGMNFGLVNNDFLKAGHPIFSLGILYNFGR